MDTAACKGQLDVMFADTIRGDGTPEAKAICDGCEDRDVCLEFALDARIDHGVWGGTGPETRRRMRQGAPRPRSSVAACGTPGGISAHRRRGEPQCRACKDAANAYKRQWWADRRKGWVA